MDTQQNESGREKAVVKTQQGNEGLPAKQQQQQQQQQQQEEVTTSAASPPSASSSPSHEFSFTISVHSSKTPVPDKTKTPHGPFAIDLTPADDIFFHGHLLPLHLLSHLPVSPRSSINSLDSFTLPVGELVDDDRYNTGKNNSCSTVNDSSNSDSDINCSGFNNKSKYNDNQRNSSVETKGRSKSKSFSLFGWRKGSEEVRDKEEDKDKQKRKLKFDVSHLLKRYVRMVRPLLFPRGRRENLQYQRKAYSFSGNLSWRSNKRELRGRRGQYSAPASMRTSPTNSGLLVATATLPSSTSDSTMEELQAAIQAAIAHCKKSIASEEKIKC